MGPPAGIEFQRQCHRLEDLCHHLGQLATNLLGGHILAETAFGQAGREPGGHRDAQVGPDEQLLELLQRLVVELALDEDIADAAADGPGRAAQPGLETPQPAAQETTSAQRACPSVPVTRAETMLPGSRSERSNSTAA